MKYLPFENVTYRTKLSTQEAIARIKENVEPAKFIRTGVFRSLENPKLFEGTVKGNSFSILQLINHRNSFVPHIKGTIKNDYAGTAVKLKLRLPPFVLIFICIWCGMAGFAPVTSFIKSGQLGPDDAIPIGMLLFVYILTVSGFKHGSKISKEQLAKILEARIDNDI